MGDKDKNFHRRVRPHKLQPKTNPSNYHKYKSIPSPRAVTINCNGYSSGGTSKPLKLRRKKLRENLEKLGMYSDFLLTQETRTTKDSLLS